MKFLDIRHLADEVVLKTAEKFKTQGCVVWSKYVWVIETRINFSSNIY